MRTVSRPPLTPAPSVFATSAVAWSLTGQVGKLYPWLLRKVSSSKDLLLRSCCLHCQSSILIIHSSSPCHQGSLEISKAWEVEVVNQNGSPPFTEHLLYARNCDGCCVCSVELDISGTCPPEIYTLEVQDGQKSRKQTNKQH